MPAANREFWDAKLRRNVDRDRDTDHRLAEAGWLVVRVWEHEDIAEAADHVVSAVLARRADWAAGMPVATGGR
jgi:DNA mismatch endonuclease (patch repair protein)